MHPADIKAALAKAGKTQVAIARGLGVHPVTVNQVIKGRCRSARIAAAIARATKVKLNDLWPGVYSQKRPAA